MQENKRRLRVSPSLVISIFALVIAMSAGAYAATIAPKNSVVSKSIKNGQVKGKDIAKNAVNAKKIKDGQVGTADVTDGSLTGADLADGQVGLNDLSAAAKTDLNDATTLGGLSVAQIVAASGGEYVEARQAAGEVDIEKTEDAPVNLVNIDLPHAGKYLISARMPVLCTYDGSDGATPANPNPLEPFAWAKAQLVQGATVLDSQYESCEAEAGQVIVFAGIYSGTAMVEINRMVTVTGPTTLTLRGSSKTSIAFIVAIPATARVTEVASGSMIQAITVQ
jgi:hypothetical protein